VKIGDGRRLSIEGSGCVRTAARDGGNILELKNVLNVPEMHCSLLSVSRITFSQSEAVAEYDGLRVFSASRDGNLYILNLENDQER
jgi:hypothetical protein